MATMMRVQWSKALHLRAKVAALEANVPIGVLVAQALEAYLGPSPVPLAQVKTADQLAKVVAERMRAARAKGLEATEAKWAASMAKRLAPKAAEKTPKTATVPAYGTPGHELRDRVADAFVREECAVPAVATSSTAPVLDALCDVPTCRHPLRNHRQIPGSKNLRCEVGVCSCRIRGG